MKVIVKIVLSFSWYQSTKVYGNDKESIIKVIKSVEGYEDKDIPVVQINDFDDVRIVGFLANHRPYGGYEYRNYKYYDENGDLIEEFE